MTNGRVHALVGSAPFMQCTRRTAEARHGLTGDGGTVHTVLRVLSRVFLSHWQVQDADPDVQAAAIRYYGRRLGAGPGPGPSWTIHRDTGPPSCNQPGRLTLAVAASGVLCCGTRQSGGGAACNHYHVNAVGLAGKLVQ
jgi:hypothetical protein